MFVERLVRTIDTREGARTWGTYPWVIKSEEGKAKSVFRNKVQKVDGRDRRVIGQKSRKSELVEDEEIAKDRTDEVETARSQA